VQLGSCFAGNCGDVADNFSVKRAPATAGTPSFSTLFNIDSSGTFTGSASNDISDIRFKENISELSGSLEKLTQLRGVRFTWKEETNLTTRPQYGVIAQEVESVFPELVIDNSIMGPGYKSVQYGGFVAPFIEAIKELDLKVEELALPEIATDSFADKFFTNLFAKVTTWLADAGNGIIKLFVKEVHTDKICVAKSDGTEFCATGDELENIVNSNGGGGSSGGSSSPSPSPSPSPEPEPESSPSSEPEPEADQPSAEEPTPEVIPEPTPEPKPEGESESSGESAPE